MFEARLSYAGTLKAVVTAVSEVLLDHETGESGQPNVITLDCE